MPRRSLLLAVLLLAALAPHARAADTSLRDPGAGAGRIPPQFIGLSVEWSLAERYTGPAARAGFANLLGNLRGGVLRMGGSSQDQMPFEATAPNTLRNITPEDVAGVRATLDAVNGSRPGRGGRPAPWGVILGTSLAPPDDEFPWRGPANAQAFTRQGVAPAFTGPARRYVTSIGLGNEPDLTYDDDLQRYLADFAAYAGVTRPFALDAPSTSEAVAPWQAIAGGTAEPRFFFAWPAILDAIAPATRSVRSTQGAASTDHYYPAARTCASDPYRCATIDSLLADDRMANLDFLAATHAGQAAERGLTYRLGELNTAAGRGVAGVSDVAVSATWALDAMFHAACPQPPDRPGANADCRLGAIGVNFHNSEVEAFYAPEQGNAYYNAVRYDPSPAAGTPTAGPEYYALLFFGRFAQGSTGLRPLTPSGPVSSWRVTTSAGRSRTFAINKTRGPQTVVAPGRCALVHRMTPFDPEGGGRTLDAPRVRVDGREVAADGTWPGDAPQRVRAGRDGLRLPLGPGEALSVEAC